MLHNLIRSHKKWEQCFRLAVLHSASTFFGTIPLQSIPLFVQLNYAHLELNGRPCGRAITLFLNSNYTFWHFLFYFSLFWVIKWSFFLTLCSLDRFIFRILVDVCNSNLIPVFFALFLLYFQLFFIYVISYSSLMVLVQLSFFFILFRPSIQFQLLFGYFHCYLIFISSTETIGHFQRVDSDCKWSAHDFNENESLETTRNAHAHMTHSHLNLIYLLFPFDLCSLFFQWQCARTYASQTIKQSNQKSVS